MKQFQKGQTHKIGPPCKCYGIMKVMRNYLSMILCNCFYYKHKLWKYLDMQKCQ